MGRVIWIALEGKRGVCILGWANYYCSKVSIDHQNLVHVHCSVIQDKNIQQWSGPRTRLWYAEHLRRPLTMGQQFAARCWIWFSFHLLHSKVRLVKVKDQARVFTDDLIFHFVKIYQISFVFEMYCRRERKCNLKTCLGPWKLYGTMKGAYVVLKDHQRSLY